MQQNKLVSLEVFEWQIFEIFEIRKFSNLKTGGWWEEEEIEFENPWTIALYR